jgi:hypothetical protein
MRYLGIVVLIVAVLALAADAAFAAGENVPPQYPRAVTLDDASYPPTFLVYLNAGQRSHDIPQGCSDLSAYRWNGKALGPQHWNRMHDRILWSTRKGRSVVFDGLSFENRTRLPVVVAAWC